MTGVIKTQIIAEAGVNHNGNRQAAFQLVDAAADAGADMVKFQTFEPEEVVSTYAPKAEYQLATTDTKQSQLDMAIKLKLNDRDFFDLAEHCKKRGIEFLSTPFDLRSVDFLIQEMGLTTIKIPSGELTNAPLLLRAARQGVDIILSTGMSNLAEVKEALGVLAFGYVQSSQSPSRLAFERAYETINGKDVLRKKVTLLHCTTEYPAPISESNLRAMHTLKESFGLDIGFSDHTPGISVAIAASVLGVKYIEKHFTLDKNLSGPDHKASLEPDELAALVKGVHEAQSALGDGIKQAVNSEIKNMVIARKSLVARGPISAGTVFTEENLAIKRPGSGISPMRYWEWLGQRAERDYAADELIDE